MRTHNTPRQDDDSIIRNVLRELVNLPIAAAKEMVHQFSPFKSSSKTRWETVLFKRHLSGSKEITVIVRRLK